MSQKESGFVFQRGPFNRGRRSPPGGGADRIEGDPTLGYRSVKIKTHPVGLGILLVPHDLHDVNDLENPPAKLSRWRGVAERMKY